MAEYAGYLAAIAWEKTTGVFETIAQVRDIAGPGITADTIEVSHRDNRWRLYQAGMRDGGELSFDVVFDPNHASHDPAAAGSIYSKMAAGSTVAFKCTFPGVGAAVTTAAFSGIIVGWEIQAPLEDGQTADMTVKISGAITWAHVP